MLGSRMIRVGMAALSCMLACSGARADALTDLNDSFRADYEAILKQNGTRQFKVSPAEAYDAVRVSLARLGMTVEAQDPVLGYVAVYGPAPKPLDIDEWKKAAAADLPRARDFVGRQVQPKSFALGPLVDGDLHRLLGALAHHAKGNFLSFALIE